MTFDFFLYYISFFALFVSKLKGRLIANSVYRQESSRLMQINQVKIQNNLTLVNIEAGNKTFHTENQTRPTSCSLQSYFLDLTLNHTSEIGTPHII